jgi:hypothetical protein
MLLQNHAISFGVQLGDIQGLLTGKTSVPGAVRLDCHPEQAFLAWQPPTLAGG